MKWLLFGLGLLLFLVLVILFIKLTFVISFSHSEDDDHFTLEIKALFGIITYRVDVPQIRVAKDAVAISTKEKTIRNTGAEKKQGHYTMEDFFNRMDDYRHLAGQIIHLHPIVKGFLKRVQLKKFIWRSEVGTGDAASTGVLCGGIWSIKGGVLAWIRTYITLRKPPQIEVHPNFHRLVSMTDFTCMFQFRIGYAILAGIKLIKSFKGDNPSFKTRPFTVLNSNNEKTFD